MDISVTDFKARCLDLIRKVEESGKAITIRRRGRVVARLKPAGAAGGGGKPWEQLRTLDGRAHVKASIVLPPTRHLSACHLPVGSSDASQ